MIKLIKRNIGNVLWIMTLLSLILTSIVGIIFIINLFSNNPDINIWNWNISTWHIFSWEIIELQEKIILENSNFSNESNFNKFLFPQIIFNRLPENTTLVATINFTDYFKTTYPSFAFSNSYWFALRFFIDDLDNGWFYNVFRRTNGSVWYDKDRGLDWWVPWVNISNSYTWNIPLDIVNIATTFEETHPWFQYKSFNIQRYIRNRLSSPLTIWVYLSSVPNVPGWQLMHIEKLSIQYEWYENDIIIVP